jgi:hypothetical protein
MDSVGKSLRIFDEHAINSYSPYFAQTPINQQ